MPLPENLVVNNKDNSWVARDVIIFENPKLESHQLLSSSGTREGKFIFVNNFSAQEQASSKSGHILNFRVMAVRDIKI